MHEESHKPGQPAGDGASDSLAEVSIRWSQNFSRRSLLAHTGRLLLRVAGVSVVTALPLAQEFAGTTAAVNCANTRYCHLSGHPCSCCGGTDDTCPAGSTRKGWWSGCCGSYEYYYYDCCANTPHTCQSGCQCSNAATGHVAPNMYCMGLQYLWCTLSRGENLCCLSPQC